MSERVKQLLEKIDALSQRERVLMLLAFLVVIYTLYDQLLLAPLDIERNQISQQISQTQNNLSKLETQIQVIQENLKQDPNKANQAAVLKLGQEIEQLDLQIAALAGKLIPPNEMAKVLEQMLTHDPGLRLVKVENLAPRPLLDNPPPAKPDANQEKDAASTNAPPTLPGDKAPSIYRHSVVIEFEGGFQSTLDYLNALETLPWLFFWDNIEYRVEEYPSAHVKITVSTLSFQEGWIGV